MIISYILISVLYVSFIAGSIYMSKKMKKYNYVINAQKEQTENVNKLTDIKEQTSSQSFQESQLPVETTITKICDEVKHIKEYIIKYNDFYLKSLFNDFNTKINDFTSIISIIKRELNSTINSRLPWYMDNKQEFIYKVSDIDNNIQQIKANIQVFLKDPNNINNIDNLDQLTAETNKLMAKIETDIKVLIEQINGKNTQYNEDLNETITPNDIVVDEANVQEQYKSLETITNEHKIDKDTLKQLVNEGLVQIK